MRPIKLEMEAFVSYKNLQVIDFTKIEGKNIFLITGETGAGKSTIFDAICFALYGKLSRDDKDKADFLKCHLADNKTLSRVKFTFKIGDEFYEIERYPHQKVYSERTKSEKERLSTATLTLPSGEVMTKLSEVNEKIKEIIGLNDKQFRQIVMLAQGEFKKFLVANSSEKQEILRKTFGTEIFSKFSSTLSQEKKSKEARIIELQRSLNKNANSFLTSDDELSLMKQSEEIDYIAFFEKAEQLLKADQNLSQNIKEKLKTQREEFSKIDVSSKEKINEKIAQKEETEKKLKTLLSNEEEINKQKQLLKQLESAVDLEPIYQKLLAKLFDLKETISQEKTESEALLLLSETQKETEKAYNTASQKLLEKETLTLKTEKLEGLKSELAEIEVANKNLNRLKLSLNENKQNGQLVETILEEAKLQRKQKSLSEIKSEMEKSEKLTKTILDLENKLREKEKELETANSEYFASAAAVLKEELKPGMKCPVCGEIIKEENFQTEIHTSPNKDRINAIQKEKTTLIKSLENAKSDNKNAILNLEKMCDALSLKRDDIEKEIFLGEKALNKICSKLKETSGRLNLAGLKSKTEEELQKSLSEFNNNFAKAEGEISQLEISLSKSLEKTKDASSVSEIEAQIKALKLEIEKITALFQNAEKAYLDAKSKKEKCEARLATITKNKETLETETKELKETFQNELLSKQIESEETYKSLREVFPQRLSIKEQCDNFDKSINSLKQTLSQLTKDLEGQEKTDLDALNNLKSALANEISQNEAKLENLNRQTAVNESLVTSSKESIKSLEEEESSYKEIAVLSNLATGTTKSKITFESYVLMAYFEEIIAHANNRLSSMSKGRYYLYRKTESSGSNRLSGLDLEILDTYSGIKRHIATLSGGESFKASLSLALGLADVLQNHYGGIKIETMFIDEGFGSLDEKSIDSAVETLYSLEKCGVLVGVISHVVHLRDKIPAKLIVETGSNGSTVKFKEM